MRSMRPFLCVSLIVFASVLSGCGEKSAPPAVQEAVKPATKQELATILKSAEAGNADAQLRLGSIYREGQIVPKDDAKAAEWMQKAAAQGLANAQNGLAEMYFTGTGVPRDSAKAVAWLQKAAAQGDAFAQQNLAKMYYEGEGVPQDAAKAAEWLQKAAAQGLAVSQNNLAAMYGKGEGVPQDAAKALEWYRKAAAQGHATAQSNLAGMYARGEGVPKDLVLAYAWLSLAATQGHADSVRDLRGAEGFLSKGELQEAQRLSTNWKKGQILARVGGSSTAQPLSPGGTFDTVADAVLKNDIVEQLSFWHKTFHPECKKAKATSAKTISVTREKASEQWVMAGCGQTYAYKVELIWDGDGKGGVWIGVQRDTPD
jgi:TPR repeat protein